MQVSSICKAGNDGNRSILHCRALVALLFSGEALQLSTQLYCNNTAKIIELF